jgi:hypothetical protein
MALLSRNKAAASAADSYIAVPSYIIAPSIAAATNELLDTLRREHATLDAETRAKENARFALNKEYKPVTAGSITFEGRMYRSGETDVDGTLQKAKADQDKKAALARAHNEELKQRQSELETGCNEAAVKALRVKVLIDIINDATHGPVLFDAAAILLTRSPQEQILYLSVLTRGKSFAFGNSGEYESADVRLLGALIDKGEKVELIK